MRCIRMESEIFFNIVHTNRIIFFECKLNPFDDLAFYSGDENIFIFLSF